MKKADATPFRSNANRRAFRWSETPTPMTTQRRLINRKNSYVRSYMLGECSVLVTRELGDWHMSIAHPDRYPNWDEIAEARYRAIPDDVWMALCLPPSGEYVNLHPNCFQLLQVPPPREDDDDA